MIARSVVVSPVFLSVHSAVNVTIWATRDTIRPSLLEYVSVSTRHSALTADGTTANKTSADTNGKTLFKDIASE